MNASKTVVEGMFGRMFTDYRIVTEKDAVRRHSTDDFGLGHGWVFVCGKHIHNGDRQVFTMCYGKVEPNLYRALSSYCSSGDLASIHLHKDGNHNVYAIFRSRDMITQRRAFDVVRGVPADVDQLISVY